MIAERGRTMKKEASAGYLTKHGKSMPDDEKATDA
jgi:hypothetical protein